MTRAGTTPGSHPAVDLPVFRTGKVRDTFDLGDQLLMVSSDRVSAFDVVLPTIVPGKGKILNQLSAFWLQQTATIVPNHLVTTDLSGIPGLDDQAKSELQDRSMIVRKADRIDVECVVRGYLAGSAWTDYRSSGQLVGRKMPLGLVESDCLERPIFTPATKADSGHDENISMSQLQSQVGSKLATQLEEKSLELFEFGSSRASAEGNLILADSKFEFGYIDGQLHLIDELFTPDSSRFWDKHDYVAGQPQPAFDKQYLRDWLETLEWDKKPPGPPVPQPIVDELTKRYVEAFRRLTGSDPVL